MNNGIGNWPRVLMDWYRAGKVDFPWRKDPSPYHVWLSEVMLQQTRLEAAEPYYLRFIGALPSVEALASAPEEKVLKLWEGLGYYSRARNLHKAAKMIMTDFGGVFPSEAEDIARLPGVGPYTAGAIAALAFGKPEVAVDGNVLRVTARLYCLEEDVLTPAARRRTEALLQEVYPSRKEGKPGDFVEGLMELGERVCVPSSPRCGLCPIRAFCRAEKEGRQDELPVRIVKTAKKTEEKTLCAIVGPNGGLLLHRRPSKGVLAGLWEVPELNGLNKDFPGNIELGDNLGTSRHVFTHLIWEMKIISAKLDASSLPKDYRWASRRDLQEEMMLPTAFQKVVSVIDKKMSLI